MDILNINLNLLKSFWAVYKTGGITSASKVLDLAPPAVTYNVKQLEKQLGCKLFVTHKKGADPTDKAREIFPLVDGAFENLFKFGEKLSAEKEIIRIGTPAFMTEFDLIDFHREFLNRHKNIKLEFHHHPRHDYLTMLENGAVDVAIMQFLRESAPHTTVFELFQSKMTFFTSKDFADKNNLGSEITFARFLELPFICHSQSRSILYKLEAAFNHKLGAIEAPSVQAAYDMVANGQGVGIFFLDYLDKEKDERVLRLKITDKPEPPNVVYSCAYQKDSPQGVLTYIREIKNFF
ncbi:MAG: LysR family transcriptional regulator [Firmicutes bacterium]|nr:LysR family transcriptional regulator [Bacillota bacterium]